MSREGRENRTTMSYVQRRRFLWVLFFVGLALAAVVANATTLARLSFEDLARQSMAIARLRCIGSESRLEGGEIWTETRFEVVERHKGMLPQTVTVRMVGGRTGNYHSRVDGVPTFRAGEEVYLFLWGRAGEPLRVLGWSQGTFRVTRDARTGRECVTQESGSGKFDPQTRTFRADGIRAMELPAFREKLQQAVERSAATRR
jgi:hypothetical protein